MQNIKRYATFLIGLAMIAFSFNLFWVPNNWAAGSATGLAMIFHNLYNINIPLFVLAINIFFLIASFFILGKSQLKQALPGSLLLPLFLYGISFLTPHIPLDDMTHMIQCLLAGLLSGFGYGLLFKSGLTTGGTDILVQMATKSFHTPPNVSLLLVDGFIIVTGMIVFGINSGIYSTIVLTIIAIISTKSITGMKENKTLFIHTKKLEEVKSYLLKNKYDTSIFKGKGGYTEKKVEMIMSVIKTNDYYKTKEAILSIDPDAFLIITDSFDTKNENKTLRKNIKKDHNL